MIRKYCKEALSFAAAMMSFWAFADQAAAKAARRFATGGEVTSFRYTDAAGVGWTAFLHTFTNTAEAAEFQNTSGKTLPVRMLAVGGGGAGMDGSGNHTTVSSVRHGGGGGGGGGVTETNAFLLIGDVWTIRVGVGGRIPSHRNDRARVSAGASSVSNGLDEVILVLGGGAGGSRATIAATEGAAGGGGSGLAAGYNSGSNGTYRSFTLKAETPVGPFKGGDSSSSDYYGAAGGGGGAGEDGSIGGGGSGLVSDISGTDVVYGSGGGGGGMIRVYPGNAKQGAVDGGSGGEGAGNAGECELKIEGEVATTNLYLTSATPPTPNRGGGGAGGASFNNKGDNLYVDGNLVEDRASTTVHYATEGADGVVIIRYDIPDTPCVGGDVVTVMTNGFRVTYIHKFTNTTEVATFKPSVAFDGTSVRLLAVGGGGAGADGYCGVRDTVIAGGGGGGGGGVTETNAFLSVGDVWTIRVGAGGGIPTHHYKTARDEAGASSVSNGVTELVLTPGGGAGGNRGMPPTPGASGGGGSGTSSYCTGGLGTYTNSICGVVPAGAPFKGGTAQSNSCGGGGGGAGGAGSATAAGVGLISNITGADETYGAGGGGGGFFRVDRGIIANGYAGGKNAGVGGMGEVEPIEGGTKTNLNLRAAQPPVANTGAGGAGGISFAGSANHDSLDPTYINATAGADGVVIIRYEVKHPTGFMVIFR